MKRFLMVMAVSLIVLAFAGTGLAADVLDITIPLPLTGSKAKFGEIEKRSYEIAAEEINAAGGIKGKKVVLHFEDSQGKPEISRAIAEKIIDVKKQPFVMGEYSSSCSKAIAAVAEERKVPYLVVTGASDTITQQNYKYVFRMNPSVSYYTGGLRSFLKKVVKPRTVAILYESTDFGTKGAEGMVKDAKKLGMKVVMKEKYESGAVDFKPILSKLKSKRPDVIYMVSYV
ncbi:MAG: amino acid ABC transporter substrate-binding protein, partial [Nitrospirae bacterium]